MVLGGGSGRWFWAVVLGWSCGLVGGWCLLDDGMGWSGWKDGGRWILGKVVWRVWHLVVCSAGARGAGAVDDRREEEKAQRGRWGA